MVQAARKYQCVVQMGTQQRSSEHFQAAVNFVKSGALGKIRLVRVWAYLDWVGELPVVPDSTAPASVDYDLWLGPAPKRAFNSNRFHFNFRWFWDYAGGLMTDWGAHMLDIANMAMGVVAPKAVMSLGGKYGFPNDATETPDTQQALFEYADFSMIWEHAAGVGRGPYDREHGVAFHGNNGVLVVDRGGWEVFPETDYQKNQRRGFKMPGMPRQGGSGEYHQAHVQNFIDCVRNRQAPRSEVEIGHNSMIACHLGNIAVRLRRRIEWDAAVEKIMGDPEAQSLVGRTYREPWQLPAL